jgi:hypothetical protein
MKRLSLAIVFALSILGVQAQIDSKVKDVMQKCVKAMENPAGVEYDMDFKIGMGEVNVMSCHVLAGSKGKMTKALVTAKVFGIEAKTETGFDGNEEWEWTHAPSLGLDEGEKKDTVIIGKAAERKKTPMDLDLDIIEMYHKATMKTDANNYVITLSEPVEQEKALPKELFLTVAKNTYYLRELSMEQEEAKITMTVTNVKTGLTDDYFRFDPTRYPDAVVVRK